MHTAAQQYGHTVNLSRACCYSLYRHTHINVTNELYLKTWLNRKNVKMTRWTRPGKQPFGSVGKINESCSHSLCIRKFQLNSVVWCGIQITLERMRQICGRVALILTTGPTRFIYISFIIIVPTLLRNAFILRSPAANPFYLRSSFCYFEGEEDDCDC